MNWYLLTSLMTGFVECGCVIAAMRIEPQRPWAWIATGLAYQVGSFCADRIPNRPVLLMALDLICTTVALDSECSLVLLGNAFSLSYRVHAWRNSTCVPVPTWAKRSARVAGFVAGALWLYPATAAVAWLIAVTATRGVKVSTYEGSVRHPWTNWMTVMLIHQLHYFTYCYFVFWIIATSMKVSPFALPACFALGWISYLSVEPLFKNRSDRLVLIAGHLLLAATLGLIAMSLFPSASLLLWVATGFGGGSVYCIGRLSGHEEEMVVAEDVGHVLGAFAGLVLTLATGSWAVVVAAAATLAAVVAVLGAVMKSPESV